MGYVENVYESLELTLVIGKNNLIYSFTHSFVPYIFIESLPGTSH